MILVRVPNTGVELLLDSHKMQVPSLSHTNNPSLRLTLALPAQRLEPSGGASRQRQRHAQAAPGWGGHQRHPKEVPVPVLREFGCAMHM